MMPTQSPPIAVAPAHITVCICTHQRPALLAQLLDALTLQQTQGLCWFDVVVVDNDASRSAWPVVQACQQRAAFPLHYAVEPMKNIALARNRAVAASRGDYVAMLDDDERPGPTWLASLYNTLLQHRATAVLGPVLPHFERTPPAWVIRGGFCERPAHATGAVLRDSTQTRTGNVLLCGIALRSEPGPFDARFGRTGGEDVDFFKRRLQRGDRIVWCHEAAVFESVPPERTTRRYFLKRALLRGVTNAKRLHWWSGSVIKSLGASLVYAVMLPPLVLVALLGREDVFMSVLMRLCDHLGKVLAVFGWRTVGSRDALQTGG
jgi:succinoglycan biosynthesis protein ExoM